MATRTQKVKAAAVSKRNLRVQPLTCAIGAEVNNVDLGAASRDPALVQEIRALLLQHKVLFFRDQDISRAEHHDALDELPHGAECSGRPRFRAGRRAASPVSDQPGADSRIPSALALEAELGRVLG
jgi:hypothetical protein